MVAWSQMVSHYNKAEFIFNPNYLFWIPPKNASRRIEGIECDNTGCRPFISEYIFLFSPKIYFFLCSFWSSEEYKDEKTHLFSSFNMMFCQLQKFFKYPAVKGPERQLGSYAVVNVDCVLGHKFECLKGWKVSKWFHLCEQEI